MPKVGKIDFAAISILLIQPEINLTMKELP
jgi:hypothetical protein